MHQLCLSIGSCLGWITEEYTDWSEWSDCSANCGQGTHERTRTCLADKCFRGESDTEIENCVNLEDCPQASESCPIFFGEGFYGFDVDYTLQARSCIKDGNRVTSLTGKTDLPHGTQCKGLKITHFCVGFYAILYRKLYCIY